MATINPLLAGRWSPRDFDETHVLSSDQIKLLLEAARWAPSAINRQPWSFVVGRRGDAIHTRLAKAVRGYSDWALGASALVLAAYEGGQSDPDYALYDLGSAVADLTLQAESLGLHVRQFATFDHALAAREFGIASPWRPVITVAVGKTVPGVEPQGRERKPVSELTPWK